MLPLLTFTSGLLAGIVGVRLLKSAQASKGISAASGAQWGAMGDKARYGLDKAQTGLRQATVSGLSVIEKSSASLREKLTVPPTPEPKSEPVLKAGPTRNIEAGPTKDKKESAPQQSPKPKSASHRQKAKPQPAPDTGSKS